jgi:hypothetical protein
VCGHESPSAKLLVDSDAQVRERAPVSVFWRRVTSARPPNRAPNGGPSRIASTIKARHPGHRAFLSVTSVAANCVLHPEEVRGFDGLAEMVTG